MNIKPKLKGKSDKFSWNLYSWVKRNPKHCRIFKGTWNNMAGFDDLGQEWLYIGFKEEDGEFIGRQLRNVCLKGSTFKMNCFLPGKNFHDVDNWTDITDEFWERYQRIGVCAVHGEKAHNWQEDGDKRTCSYCGKVERKIYIFQPILKWVGDGI